MGSNFVVDSSMIGLATSLAIWTLNIGLLIVPSVIGSIYDANGYVPAVMSFVVMNGVLLVSTILFRILATKSAPQLDQKGR